MHQRDTTTDFEPVRFLEELVRIESYSGEETAAAHFLVATMQRLGMHSFVDAAGNAVGIVGASDPAHLEAPLVLLGHIDTVGGVVPVRTEGGRLYGRGTVDAKGPFATFVVAAAQRLARGPLQRPLVLVGAVEEEAASSKGAHYILDKYTPAACIIGEPSGWDKLTLGYKGRLLVEGRWQTDSAHSAGRNVPAAERAVSFWNAIQGYCIAYNEDKTRLFDQVLPSLRAINSGGDGLREWASLTVGLRLPPEVQPAELEELLCTFANQGDLSFRGGCMAYQGDKNNTLVRAMLKGVRAAGGKPGFLLKTGTSDMNVVGPVWQCPILAYGPGDSSLDHTPDEHIEIAEYQRAIDTLTIALHELT
ncbi:MAG: [LysW]-lysine hydrolase [Chloroflexaceae bacterium]|nr:[LysW]-lysine hydrolase [Chloroflexaceae bacterium]NJO05519.1 [LysW]-lysine hydrolase [Chloroflexaceae bacterium]